MLSNAYFLAKFRFDTAENEPTKNLQKSSVSENMPQGIGPLLPHRTGASEIGSRREIGDQGGELRRVRPVARGEVRDAAAGLPRAAAGGAGAGGGP